MSGLENTSSKLACEIERRYAESKLIGPQRRLGDIVDELVACRIAELRQEIAEFRGMLEDACDDWQTSIEMADVIKWNPLEQIKWYRQQVETSIKTDAIQKIAANNSADPILANFEHGVRDGIAAAASGEQPDDRT